MNRLIINFIFFFLFVGGVVPLVFSAEAPDQPEYAKVGPWSIRVDTTLDYGCFIFAAFEGGTALRFGFNMTDQTIYAMVGDPKWKSLEWGKAYHVIITFGDEEPWSGDAMGFSFDEGEDGPWLWINVGEVGDVAELFFTEFMQEGDFALDYKGKEITKLSLRGSHKAGLKLLECQEEMLEMGEDPFKEISVDLEQDPFKS